MKRSVKILWQLFFGGILFIILLFLLANFGLFGKMPSITELENPEADLATEIYSSDGVLMGKYYAENRSEVKYNEISPNVIEALVATEDERFYDHSGIDAKAVARAVIKLGTDGGGSPITQQLAKMMLDQGHGNIITRGIQKIKEWIIAVKLERNFTKEEIITLYLNRAAWGNAYGIRNASKIYFQKEPKDLKVEEAAVLVGMLKGWGYNPIGHPEKALNRRNTVIERMQDCKEHYLTAAEATKLKAKPLITNFKKLDENIGIAPYFRDALKDKLKTWCATHKNPKTSEPYDLYRSGLKIYTTINTKMQQYAEEAVEKHMPVIQKTLDYIVKYEGNKMWKAHENTILNAMKNSERWKNMEDEDDNVKEDDIKKTFYTPVKMKVFAWNAKHEKDTILTPYDSIKYMKQIMQTSFAAIDPKTGEIKCWVGGIDYKWFKYDHVTTNRQVGSTIKPFIYTLGVQDAGYTPATEIDGGPVMYGGEMRQFSGGGGTLANCLAYSKNTASVRITNTVGVKRVIEFARSCGITSKLPSYTSIALGAAEIPLIQMLQGYTMFPNHSFNTEPIYLTRIEDKSGNILQEFTTSAKQVISEASAYTMVQLMQGVVEFGTAKNLNAYNIPVQKAGKTGTTNESADGWFIGYTPELLAGTWVGCEDPFIKIYSATSGGNVMAAPKWGLFMSKVYADKKLGYGKITAFEKPTNLTAEELSADADISKLVTKGDSTTIDNGNGDAIDFSVDSSSNDINQAPVIIDTAKNIESSKHPTNSRQKNEPKAILPTTNKPAKEKTDKPKTTNTNEY